MTAFRNVALEARVNVAVLAMKLLSTIEYTVVLDCDVLLFASNETSSVSSSDDLYLPNNLYPAGCTRSLTSFS